VTSGADIQRGPSGALVWSLIVAGIFVAASTLIGLGALVSTLASNGSDPSPPPVRVVSSRVLIAEPSPAGHWQSWTRDDDIVVRETVPTVTALCTTGDDSIEVELARTWQVVDNGDGRPGPNISSGRVSTEVPTGGAGCTLSARPLVIPDAVITYEADHPGAVYVVRWTGEVVSDYGAPYAAATEPFRIADVPTEAIDRTTEVLALLDEGEEELRRRTD